jgi:hypothetical protein
MARGNEKQESIDDRFERGQKLFVHRVCFSILREFSRSFSIAVELSASSPPRMVTAGV